MVKMRGGEHSLPPISWSQLGGVEEAGVLGLQRDEIAEWREA